jgi:hypothetical protein
MRRLGLFLWAVAFALSCALAFLRAGLRARLALGLVACSFLTSAAPAQYEQPVPAKPELAVVRLPSHGASATIICTSEGRSWILSCAHMYADAKGNPDPALRAKRHTIDGYRQPHAKAVRGTGLQLLAWDYQADLSLLVIDNGPFFHIPVADGVKPRANVLSIGYDSQAWPVVIERATPLPGGPPGVLFTREHPVPGRSGGGLIDGDERRLIGTCIGFEVLPGNRPGRGMYVTGDTVRAFLKANARYFTMGPLPTPSGATSAAHLQPAPQAAYNPFQGLGVQPFQQIPCPT